MKAIRPFFQGIRWMPLAKKAYAAVPKRIREQPLILKISECVLDERFFTDPLYRTAFSLYPGFAANLLYAAMQLVLGICYRSIWSGALAVYYGLLAVMRVQLLRPMKHGGRTEQFLYELQRYRLCGTILLCMTPLFATIMILVVHKDGGARYPGFTIAVMVVYALWLVISSVSNLVKFRKYQRPAMSAAKIISLTAALMSVLSLTTALAGRMGDRGSDGLKHGLVGTAGGAVCVVVLSMAVYMVIHGTKQLKLFGDERKKEDDVSNSFHKPQIR